jgi:hypothetical protein
MSDYENVMGLRRSRRIRRRVGTKGYADDLVVDVQFRADQISKMNVFSTRLAGVIPEVINRGRSFKRVKEKQFRKRIISQAI